MALTVLHAPTHVARDPRVIRRAVKTGADTIGFSEAMYLLGHLAARPRYRLTVGSGAQGRDFLRGMGDTPILTRKTLASLGSGAMQVSEPSTPIRIAPARWATFSIFKHEVGDVAHINLHPNAAVRGKPRSVPRVREYAESMATLRRLIHLFKAEGYLVVVTGDLNYPNIDGPAFSPHDVFEKTGLDVWAVGIDYIAYDPRLELTTQRVIREGTLSDHPWLRATFVRKAGTR